MLVAGYPKGLREENPSEAWIGSGPYSAIFRVTVAEANRCKCLIERRNRGIAATRQLAKRQFTWLRASEVTAFDPYAEDTFERVLAAAACACGEDFATRQRLADEADMRPPIAPQRK